MSHFSGHFEGASTFLTPKLDNLRGKKSLGPLKMSLEMAHKVIVPQKKIMSRSFLNSGTLIVITYYFAQTISALFRSIKKSKQTHSSKG
jgi:hypothetical protein